MFDIGWSEMLIIAMLAIVVIGPKQLPHALRSVGYWVAKVRGMARDFQNQIDDVVRETELNEVKQDIQSIANMDVENKFNEFTDPSGTSDGSFERSTAHSIGTSENAASTVDDSAHQYQEPEPTISFNPPEFNDITEPVVAEPAAETHVWENADTVVEPLSDKATDREPVKAAGGEA